MRILHAVHDFLPDQVAGVEVHTAQVASAQSLRHEVGVLFARFRPDRSAPALVPGAWEQCRSFALEDPRRLRAFEEGYRREDLRPLLSRALDEFEPDVLHLQHLMNLSLTLVEEARARRIPIVMTLHDHWLSCAQGGQRLHPRLGGCDTLDASRCGECTIAQHGMVLRLRGARRRARARRVAAPAAARSNGVAPRQRLAGLAANALTLAGLFGAEGRERAIEARWRAMRSLGNEIACFLAPSEDMRDQMVAFGLPAERVRLCRHGFPARFERRVALPPLARRFAYLGSIVRHKGVHVLIEAFDSMPAEATLAVHGSLADDPDYAAELAARARHPGIRFEGESPPERVPQLLHEVDCLVVPSIWRENAPLVVQEAFASGVPVLASDLGGLAESLRDGGGRSFPVGDAAALTEQLAELASVPGALAQVAASIPAVRSLDDLVEELDALYAALARAASADANANEEETRC